MSILQNPINFNFRGRSPRRIKNLLWAERCQALFGPQKYEGARLAGINFEKRFYGNLLRSGFAAIHNPWIHFEDENGEGYACPDIVIPNQQILIECKLTLTGEATSQLSDLYLPLAREIWQKDAWKMVVAVKNWNGPLRRPILDISEAKISQINFLIV